MKRDPITDPQPGDTFVHHRGFYCFTVEKRAPRNGIDTVHGYTMRLPVGDKSGWTNRSVKTIGEQFAFEYHVDPTTKEIAK